MKHGRRGVGCSCVVSSPLRVTTSVAHACNTMGMFDTTTHKDNLLGAGLGRRVRGEGKGNGMPWEGAREAVAMMLAILASSPVDIMPPPPSLGRSPPPKSVAKHVALGRCGCPRAHGARGALLSINK